MGRKPKAVINPKETIKTYMIVKKKKQSNVERGVLDQMQHKKQQQVKASKTKQLMISSVASLKHKFTPKKNEPNRLKFIMMGGQDILFKKKIQISFDPKDRKKSGNADKNVKQSRIPPFFKYKQVKCLNQNSIIPTFNRDRKYFTPTFIIPSQIPLSDQTYLWQHRQKILSAVQQPLIQDGILIAKPRSKSRFCAVCNITYQDYYIHIETVYHKRNIKNNAWNDLIIMTAKNWQRSQQINRRRIPTISKADSDQTKEIQLNLTFEKQKLSQVKSTPTLTRQLHKNIRNRIQPAKTNQKTVIQISE